MISYGNWLYHLIEQVVEYLLWAAICMESSVPLMAVKFLPLRGSIYTAVCQCYYDIDQPLQAEVSLNLLVIECFMKIISRFLPGEG